MVLSKGEERVPSGGLVQAEQERSGKAQVQVRSQDLVEGSRAEGAEPDAVRAAPEGVGLDKRTVTCALMPAIVCSTRRPARSCSSHAARRTASRTSRTIRRILVMFTPAGMERFFEGHAKLPPGPVDP